MAYGRRDIEDGPWRYCARCDRKMLINVELGWQRGKLLCYEFCWDNRLIGDREVFIDKVISDGKEELAPVQKIREPDLQETDDDILL